MLRVVVARFSTKLAARSPQTAVLTKTKIPNHLRSLRYFSKSPTGRQKTDVAGASAAVAAGPQVSATASPALGDSVTDKIVDISATSDLTISQVAEGLSSDLLTASGIVPTLQDMGLGSYYTPAGLLQNVLDMLHNAGLPWWVSIACMTVVIKTFMIPVVIKATKNATKLHNTMPEMQMLQLKMSEARRSGNMLQATKAGNDLALFMKDNDINVFRSFVPTLIQAPIFISFFVALRAMANLPMESMKTGGISWFTDLTVPDPYYILPVVTCTTVFVMLEIGSDGAARAESLKNAKYFLRAVPFIMLPFVINFPAALLCYWTTSNFFALAQSVILRQPAVRTRFNIPQLKKHDKRDLPLSKGFVQDMKDNYTNAKLTGEIRNRAHSDEIRFKQAGTGPLVKTFKHPQKLKTSANN